MVSRGGGGVRRRCLLANEVGTSTARLNRVCDLSYTDIIFSGVMALFHK